MSPGKTIGTFLYDRALVKGPKGAIQYDSPFFNILVGEELAYVASRRFEEVTSLHYL